MQGGVVLGSLFGADGQDAVLGLHAGTYDGAVGDVGVVHVRAEVGGTYLDAEVLGGCRSRGCAACSSSSRWG